MLHGTGTTSLIKLELDNQRIPSVGFVKTQFAHKAAAGATGISLNSLSLPPEMSANGFSNPSVTQLAAANLLFYQANLTLTSSMGTPLIRGLSYVVASSTQINFLGFTALEGEIFTGTIDYTAVGTGKVVDARAINTPGVLLAGQTDFNVGDPFRAGQYISKQIGSVLVFKGGVLQVRNTSNSSVTLDGNYYEVDNGGGLGTIIRFNQADPFLDLNIVVLSNGLLTERPDGSMFAYMENLQGQLNNMATYVRDATGASLTAILGLSPTNQDLKAFGDTVSSIGTKVTTLQQLETTPGSGLPKLATSTVSGATLVPNAMIRVQGNAGYGAVNTTINRWTTTVSSVGTGVTFTNDANAGSAFTINETGIYSINFSQNTSGAAEFGISLNSAQLTTQVGTITSADRLAMANVSVANHTAQCNFTGRLTAGDVLRPHGDTTGGGAGAAKASWTITQLFRF